MTTQHDAFADVIEAWLDIAPAAEDPDSVLDRVVAGLEVTRQQRRSWLAWSADVNPFIALGLATGALLVGAFIGLQLLGGQSVGGPQFGDPDSTESPSPSPVTTASLATPAATPTVAPLPRGIGGQIDAGSYRLGPGTGVDTLGNAILPPMTLTIGEGWGLWHDSHSPPGLDKDGEGSLAIWALAEIDTGGRYGLTEEEMACGASYSPDPTLFVDATIENVVAYEWAESTGTIIDTVVDGRPAKSLIEESELSDRIHCPGDPAGPPWDPATTGRIRITTTVVEVAGSVVFIGTERWAGADSIQVELDEIIESIRFE